GERVRAVAQNGAERERADDERGEAVRVAGEAVDGRAEVERDRRSLEPGLGDGGERRRQRIDRDRLGRGRGGAEVALGVPGNRREAQGEVRVVGRRDKEARQIPAGDVDRRAAGGGGERVNAVAQNGAE